MSRCFLCQNPANEACDECDFDVRYCSEAHLKVHRCLNAGPRCSPFRIERRPVIGNVMVAVRQIKATEIILEEHPAVFGPNLSQRPQKKCCLECLKIGCTGKCRKCGFPVCEEACVKTSLHGQLECSILSQLGNCPDFGTRDHDSSSERDSPDEPREDLFMEFSAILPLRLLEMRDSNPELGSRVNLLMDHVAEMREEDKDIWQATIVDFIRERCNYDKHSSVDVLRAVGICLTNGVNQGGMHGHGLYPTFSFLSHSCTNNARFQVHPDRRLVLSAQQDICAGDEITTRYLPALMGSIRRRLKLKKSWYFDCLCQRCRDPTELGSMAGAVRCQRCSKEERKKKKQEDSPSSSNPQPSSPVCMASLFSAFLENKKGVGGYSKLQKEEEEEENVGYLLPLSPLEYFGDYKCNQCDKKTNGLTIFGMCKSLEEEIDLMNKLDQRALEEKLAKLLKVFHTNHYLVVKVKKHLLDITSLSLCSSSLSSLSLEDKAEVDPEVSESSLARQVALGKDLLKVVTILEPGYSLNKGRILRQLHWPTLQLAKLRLKAGSISKAEFLTEARKAIVNMKEAVMCLEDFGEVSDGTSLKDDSGLSF